MATFHSDDLEFLLDEDNWRYGPVLEVRIGLAEAHSAESVIFHLLSDPVVHGPFRSRAGIGAWYNTSLATQGIPREGLCILSDPCKLNVPLGARYFTSSYGSMEALWLCIPPRHIERLCGVFPWECGPDWVTPQIVELHSTLIQLCRRVYRRIPFVHAVIQDEAWLFNTADLVDTGIVVHRNVAEAGGWPVVVTSGDFAVLSAA